MRTAWACCLLLLGLVGCTTPKVQTAAPAPPPCMTEGLASWYGPQPGSNRMADGHTFDPAALTAANRWLPLGTRVRVTDLDSGRSVTVRITDRGPVAHGRIIDLSPAAATALAMRHDGVAHVRLELADPASATVSPAVATTADCPLTHPVAS